MIDPTPRYDGVSTRASRPPGSARDVLTRRRADQQVHGSVDALFERGGRSTASWFWWIVVVFGACCLRRPRWWGGRSQPARMEAVMGLYGEHVLPRVINVACAMWAGGRGTAGARLRRAIRRRGGDRVRLRTERAPLSRDRLAGCGRRTVRRRLEVGCGSGVRERGASGASGSRRASPAVRGRHVRLRVVHVDHVHYPNLDAALTLPWRKCDECYGRPAHCTSSSMGSHRTSRSRGGNDAWSRYR